MKHSYDVSTLQTAVSEILEGKKSMRKASKDHKIPYASLHKVIRTGKLEINKPGPSPILHKDEEDLLVKWIECCQQVGACRMEEQLLDQVQKIIKSDGRVTPFVDGRPGKSWLKSFYKRNQGISKRTPEAVSKNREMIVQDK